MKTPLFLSLVLASILAISGSLFGVSSANANGCINPAAGTVDDPYLIQTPANLSCLKNNSNYYWGSGKYFRQTADLNMTGENWSSGIGTSGTSGEQFLGHFDGGNFEISGFDLSPTADTYVGLFGYAGTGSSITNVHLNSATISMTGSPMAYDIGLLVGYSAGTVLNSSTSGTINVNRTNGIREVGGLIGRAVNGSISNSSSSVNIVVQASATGGPVQIQSIGGLVGYAYETSFVNVQATGNLTSQSPQATEYSGSLIGYGDNITVSNAFASGDIAITGPIVQSAGLIGSLMGSGSPGSSISNSFWDSETTGADQVGISSQSGVTAVRNTTGLSTSLLQTFNTYASANYLSSAWDIYGGYESSPTKIWGICPGNSYPFLRAQTLINPCSAINASVTVSVSSVVINEGFPLEISGLPGNFPVRIELHSTPQILATWTSNVSGVASGTITIPDGTSVGSHSLVIIDDSTGEVLSTSPLTVVAAEIAQTGTNSYPFLFWGMLFLLIGLAIQVLRKKFFTS